MTPTILLLCGVGCYDKPNLPAFEGVPISVDGGCAGACDSYRVVYVACVIDGDTFDIGTCGTGERVRLLGIDAPEVAHGDEAAECYADAAKDRLTSLIEGEYVGLSFDTTCEGVYGRTLAYVWMLTEDPDTAIEAWERDLLNDELLSEGWANRYAESTLEGELCYGDILDSAADAAEAAGTGLHGACL